MADHELRTIRAMIGDYRQNAAVAQWFHTRAGQAMRLLVYLSAAAVLVSSIYTLAKAATGG